MFRRAIPLVISLAVGGLTGCIPYAVGTTATPVPVGHSATTLSVTAMPSFGVIDSSRGASWMSLDMERRVSIDAWSDAGFRVVNGSGVIANYKRLLTDTSSTSDIRVAVMPGVGIVNFGSHAHFEATLLVSGYEPPPGPLPPGKHRPLVVAYGGLRIMQVAPLNPDAVHDTPTAGGFLGVKFGDSDLGVSPEVGVFYDHSALGVRSGNTVVVPSLNVHGDAVAHFLWRLVLMR